MICCKLVQSTYYTHSKREMFFFLQAKNCFSIIEKTQTIFYLNNLFRIGCSFSCIMSTKLTGLYRQIFPIVILKHEKHVLTYICYRRKGFVGRIRSAWPKSHRVLNILNMVISRTKTQFYTSCMKSKYGRFFYIIIFFLQQIQEKR